MAVSKRLRFEILKRDNHACRYCGATAPEARITVDHVVPVALGGTDDPSNLVASCDDCNSGKSATPPGAPLVADVASDALRWARAMTEAAQVMLADYRGRAATRDAFLDAWNAWTYGFGERKQNFPLPAGWESSVDAIIAAGLPIQVLCECVDVTMAQKYVKDEFRYMCGVAWRKVAELREIAASLVAADDSEN